jgi:hypothetical protein
MKRLYRSIYTGDDPYCRLIYDSISKAVYDFNFLMEKGVIVDLKSIQEWPKDGRGKAQRYLNHYSRVQQVEELIAFFRDKWVVRMLNAIDSDIDGIGLLKKINIEKACAAH